MKITHKFPGSLGLVFLLLFSFLLNAGCVSSARSKYFGKTQPPKDNVLRYVSGDEPETLDPQLSSGQPEARLYMALYDGLVEYHPKTMQAIPAIAKSWEISPKIDEFLFHLRDNAKWSDGTPITANDFVYSLRRGFAPETLSRTVSMGYAIKYAQAYNGHQVFVKKNDTFLLAENTAEQNSAGHSIGPETEFHKFISSPERLTLPADEKKRSKLVEADPKLKADLEGAEFVPVTAEDIGVEAIDDHTLRLTLHQSTPFFLGLLPHQFFRLVPQKTIEKFGTDWTRPENIVTCGPFKVKEVRPYDRYVFDKDPNYWDAANVHLDAIEFYPTAEQTTMLNLYKAGVIDAFLNHTVPSSWIDEIKQYKGEYLNFPEMATAYYAINTTKPPFDDLKVRQAFSMSIDRDALSNFRKVTKPLYFQTPTGIFPDYDKIMDGVGEELRKQRSLSPEEWTKYKKQFDPEHARKLLTDAGFPVQQSGNSFSCPTFPADRMALNYNTNEMNRLIAEFIQAQWKQNLGVVIPLKSMESKTFRPMRNELQYEGFSLLLWSGDYTDPYTFLNLYYGQKNESGTGFYDPNFDRLLDEANVELDPQKRYEKLARAEYALAAQLPAIPLTLNSTNWMKKPYIKGLYPNPGTLHPWKFVYIERDPAKWDADVENIMTSQDEQVERQLRELQAATK